MQTTIAKTVEFRGQALHSGAAVHMQIQPAAADHGIVFMRADLPGQPRVPALWDHVQPTRLCTLLDDGAGTTIATIEHVMAALSGCGIHNALIVLDGPEVPILDGSARPFVEAFSKTGIRNLMTPIRAIRVLKEVRVEEGLASASLSPNPHLDVDFTIDFTDAAIGHQQRSLALIGDAFRRELADSRTFCRLADVAMMQESQRALGGTYFNAVVVDGDRVLTPGGLRHADEPVRHKMLDAVGDLALAGAPLLARYEGHRAGHALTGKLLAALFAQPDAWEYVTPASDRLPGLCGKVVDQHLPADLHQEGGNRLAFA